MRASFPEHGRIDPWLEGAIVRVDAQGPFNREAMVAIGERMVALYASLPEAMPVVELVELRGSALMPPDALEVFEGSLHAIHQLSRTVRGSAWIIAADVEGGDLMARRCQRLFDSIGRPFRVATSIAEGEAWARRLLEDGSGP